MARSDDRTTQGYYLPSDEELEEQNFNFADGIDAADVLKFADYAIGYLADQVASAMEEWNQQYQEIGKTRYLVRRIADSDIVPSEGEGDWQLAAEEAGGDIV